MKLLTATSETQGQRKNDYVWTVEGELVWIGMVCDSDLRDPDGGCGCGRAFSGLSSHRATTTAMVRDLPMTRDDFRVALGGYLESAGYLPGFGEDTSAEIDAAVEEMISFAAPWPVGTVLGRRLDDLVLRASPSS